MTLVKIVLTLSGSRICGDRAGHRRPRRLAAVPLVVLLALAACAVAQDPSGPGPYQAGTADVTVPRSGGGSFAATLFYPATAPGAGAPLDPTGGPYPGVSFGHGFLQPVGQYESTLGHLATWGYFAIAARSQGGLFPNHGQFASDIRDCLTWLEAQNALETSPFHEGVDVGAFGVGGHSMGGGAAILAAAADERIRALAALAPAETNPSAIAAMAGVGAAARLINGSEDSIVPVDAHGRPMYENGGAPRQLLIIAGGFHCGFTDADFLFCDSGSISRAEQLALTRRELTRFFGLHLDDDQASWRTVWGPPAFADAAIAVELDAGIELSPEALVLEGPPGSVSATIAVTNTDDVAAAYTILIEENAWSADASPAGTGILAPGQSQEVEITVTVPAGPGPDVDELLVTARNDGDGATRGYLEMTVRRTPGGDLDGDGLVGFSDLLLLLAVWGDCPPPPAACTADLDGDGLVGFADLLTLLAVWS